MPTPRVPGIGFIGLGQMDPANQLVFSQAFGRIGGKRSARKRRTKAAAAPRRRRAKAKRRGRVNGRLKKGSAAAKRRMAKLRRMRK